MPVKQPSEPFKPTPEQQRQIDEGLQTFSEFRRKVEAGEIETRKMRPGKADAPLGIEIDDEQQDQPNG